jgi:HK97 family phage major capsid protein
MSTVIQQLRDNYAAKSAEANALLSKADPTTEDVIAAKTLIEVELPGLQGQIELMNGVGGLKSKLNDHQSWQDDPVGGSTNLQGAKFMGFEAAGFSQIVQEGKKSVLYSEGEGLLPDAKIRAIREPKYAEAFKSWLRAKGDITMLGRDAMKTLSEGLDEDGGYLAPAEILEKIIERLPTPSRVSGLVTGLTTSRPSLTMPKVNYSADDIYTTGIRVNWTGERGKPNQGEAKFGTKSFQVFTAMLQLNATNDLLEDTGFGVNGWVANKFSQTVQIVRDAMALGGTGNGQPFGMLSRVGNGADQIKFVKTGAAADLTADSLIDLSYDIPEQYMDDSRWLMNRTNTERRIAKLKDADGRYLFAGGRESDTLANTRPSEMLGFGITRSALMPNIAANAYPILFGCLRGYYQIERIGFSMRTLDQVGALDNETIFVGRLRMGGDTAEEWMLRALKCAA